MEKNKPVRKAKSKTENEFMSCFIKAQIFALLMYFVFFISGSLIALAADLSGKYDYIFTVIIFSLGSLSVGFFSGMLLRRNGLLSGILNSLPLNIIVILISLFINQFNFSINLLITAIALLLSAGIGGILAVNKRLRR